MASKFDCCTVMQSFLRGKTQYYFGSGRGLLCQAARHEGNDVVSLEWLLECEAARDLVPLMPRHYINVSRATLDSLDNVSPFCDPYYINVDERDMCAILHSHVRIADVHLAQLATEAAGAATSPAKRRSRVAAAAARAEDMDSMPILRSLAAELASSGTVGGAGSSPFLGCKAAIVRLPPMAAAEAAADADAEPGVEPAAAGAGGAVAATAVAARAGLQDCILRRLQLQLRLHGGRTAAALDASTTHLLLLGSRSGGGGLPLDAQQPLDPAAVLAAVREQAGGIVGLKAMRAGLQQGSLKLVTPRWIDDGIQAAAAGEPLPPEQNHELPLLQGRLDSPADAADGWPWAQVGLTASPVKVSPAKRPTPIAKGPTARTRAMAPERGRGRGAKRKAAAPPDTASSDETAGGSDGGAMSSGSDMDDGREDSGGVDVMTAAAAMSHQSRADRARRRRRRGGASGAGSDSQATLPAPSEDDSQLADADADLAAGGPTLADRRAAHRIEDDDDGAAAAPAAPSQAAASQNACRQPSRKVSLLDVMLRAAGLPGGTASDGDSPPPPVPPLDDGGFLDAAAPAAAGEDVKPQRPPPATSLRERLKKMGVLAPVQ